MFRTKKRNASSMDLFGKLHRFEICTFLVQRSTSIPFRVSWKLRPDSAGHETLPPTQNIKNKPAETGGTRGFSSQNCGLIGNPPANHLWQITSEPAKSWKFPVPNQSARFTVFFIIGFAKQTYPTTSVNRAPAKKTSWTPLKVHKGLDNLRYVFLCEKTRETCLLEEIHNSKRSNLSLQSFGKCGKILWRCKLQQLDYAELQWWLWTCSVLPMKPSIEMVICW